MAETWSLQTPLPLFCMPQLNTWDLAWAMGREGQGLFECKLHKIWQTCWSDYIYLLLFLCMCCRNIRLTERARCWNCVPDQLANPHNSRKKQLEYYKPSCLFLLSEVSHPELSACFPPNWTFMFDSNFLQKSQTKQ